MIQRRIGAGVTIVDRDEPIPGFGERADLVNPTPHVVGMEEHHRHARTPGVDGRLAAGNIDYMF